MYFYSNPLSLVCLYEAIIVCDLRKRVTWWKRWMKRTGRNSNRSWPIRACDAVYASFFLSVTYLCINYRHWCIYYVLILISNNTTITIELKEKNEEIGALLQRAYQRNPDEMIQKWPAMYGTDESAMTPSMVHNINHVMLNANNENDPAPIPTAFTTAPKSQGGGGEPWVNGLGRVGLSWL